MIHRTSTLAVAAAATAGLLAAGGAPALGSPHARAALISTPKLVIHETSSTITVKGPHRFSAGRVSVTLIAHKGEQEVGFFRLHKGYTYADAKRDFAAFFSSQTPTPAGIKALNRVVRHVTLYGGFDTGTGHKTVSGSVVLPRAGTYLVINDDQGPGSVPPVRLHVTKRVGNRVTPTSSATVKAITAKRFRGATTLPAAGTITFKNESTNSPHFLALQHVKAGTTRKQVIAALNSGPGGSGPNPFENGTAGTDALGMGQSQTLTYKLPAGTYAEMCFFPDLQTGMPHALMGMVRIVHLR